MKDWILFYALKIFILCVVNSVSPIHISLWLPSKDQLDIYQTKAGDYSRFSSITMKDLMKLLDFHEYVDC